MSALNHTLLDVTIHLANVEPLNNQGFFGNVSDRLLRDTIVLDTRLGGDHCGYRKR
jgi:hypothetical protein